MSKNVENISFVKFNNCAYSKSALYYLAKLFYMVVQLSLNNNTAITSLSCNVFYKPTSTISCCCPFVAHPVLTSARPAPGGGDKHYRTAGSWLPPSPAKQLSDFLCCHAIISIN